MKLQINSLEALERLIGGDTEVELELRNSIVQEFTKKHLKGLATGEQLKVIEEIKQGIKNETAAIAIKELGINVRENNNWPYKMVVLLNDSQKAAIKEAVKEHVNRLVSEEYYAATKTLSEDYRKMIEDAVDNHIKKYSAQIIKETIEKKVAEKLKDIKIDL